MPISKKDIYWLLQQNITNAHEYERLQQACMAAGVGYDAIDIIPFTDTLPPVNPSRSYIIYGSITLSRLAVKEPLLQKGVFFDETIFSMENYLSQWGRHMLNAGAGVLTLNDLVKKDIADDKLLFIRPDNDNKSFAGEVKRFAELKQWHAELIAAERTDLSHPEKLIVAEPWNIRYEWRCWIVNKKVVAASKYRENFRLKKEPGCPPEVIAFAEDRCMEYTPHAVFVMDICLCGEDYYIVECGSMNAAGFYHADINQIVVAVTDYFSTLPA